MAAEAWQDKPRTSSWTPANSSSSGGEQEPQAGWRNAWRPWGVAPRGRRWRSRRPAWHGDLHWRRTSPGWWRRPYAKWGEATTWPHTEEETGSQESPWSDWGGSEGTSHILSTSEEPALATSGPHISDGTGQQPAEEQLRTKLVTRKELVRAARDACDAQSEEWKVLNSLVTSTERQLREKDRHARIQQMETDYHEATRELEQAQMEEQAIEVQIQGLQVKLEDLKGKFGKTQQIIRAGKKTLTKLGEQMKTMRMDEERERDDAPLGGLSKQLKTLERGPSAQQPHREPGPDAERPKDPEGKKEVEEQDAPPGIQCQERPLTRAQKRALKKQQATEDGKHSSGPRASASEGS